MEENQAITAIKTDQTPQTALGQTKHFPARIENYLADGLDFADLPEPTEIECAQLRAFIDQPTPPAASESEIRKILAGIAAVTAQRQKSDQDVALASALMVASLRQFSLPTLQATARNLAEQQRFFPTLSEFIDCARAIENKRTWPQRKAALILKYAGARAIKNNETQADYASADEAHRALAALRKQMEAPNVSNE